MRVEAEPFPIAELVQDVAQDFRLRAEKAGIEPGDIILEFDGETVETSNDLPPLVGSNPPGSEAEVLVSLGREDTLDRDGLVRLVTSINRYLGLPQAGMPADAAELLAVARGVARRRVVVKRPVRAAPLAADAVAGPHPLHRLGNRLG